MSKRPFIRKPKRKKHGTTFWDNEYSEGGTLKLSDDASEDLEKFTRWLERQTKREFLNPTSCVLDMGCGNGRNLVYLAEKFGMHGTGYDISPAAIKQAVTASTKYNIKYVARSMTGDIDLPDQSQTFVLDMMSSHFLNKSEREHMREEVHRVLKPGGWFFVKTFLRDGDLHTGRLLKEFPTKEEGTYKHPVMGMDEHVYYEEDLIKFLEERFVIHKVYRSHKHISRGKARKRRTISIYAERNPFVD
ncbi:class I SAM-dependent methyltransferase [Candidatus Pacebacteria bacterium]|nr:class I SAM-dependent methyltransferase [Candidatus Paceibacterota bacterium]